MFVFISLIMNLLFLQSCSVWQQKLRNLERPPGLLVLNWKLGYISPAWQPCGGAREVRWRWRRLTDWTDSRPAPRPADQALQLCGAAAARPAGWLHLPRDGSVKYRCCIAGMPRYATYSDLSCPAAALHTGQPLAQHCTFNTCRVQTCKPVSTAGSGAAGIHYCSRGELQDIRCTHFFILKLYYTKHLDEVNLKFFSSWLHSPAPDPSVQGTLSTQHQHSSSANRRGQQSARRPGWSQPGHSQPGPALLPRLCRAF